MSSFKINAQYACSCFTNTFANRSCGLRAICVGTSVIFAPEPSEEQDFRGEAHSHLQNRKITIDIVYSAERSLPTPRGRYRLNFQRGPTQRRKLLHSDGLFPLKLKIPNRSRHEVGAVVCCAQLHACERSELRTRGRARGASAVTRYSKIVV